MCFKFSTKYNRWYTLFFHIHCFACFLCLISLLFFGRLLFDDLDKRQFIHLGIHIAIVACLLTLLTGNRCELPRFYFLYFIGYHFFLITNIGLEIYTYYTTPHSLNRSLHTQETTTNSNDTVLITTTIQPLNTTRFPNGQPSPYNNMQEEALYSLVLICIIVQTYITLVMFSSYKYLIDKKTNNKVHTMETIVVKPKTSSNELENDQSTSNQQINTIMVEKKPDGKWEKRFHTAGNLATLVMKVLPKK